MAMDAAPPIEPQPAESQPQEMSLPARLLNVFAAPGEVFDYIKTRPHSVANWITPAILLLAVAIVASGFIFTNEAIDHQVNEIFDKQFEQQKIPAEQAEMARKIGGVSMKVGVFFGPAVLAFILPFWTGLIFWLIGAKLWKANFEYMKAVEAAGLTGMILVLDSIVRGLLIIVMGNIFVSLSPGLFIKDFNPGQNPMHGTLAQLNVLMVWSLFVQSVALSRLGGRSFWAAFAWLFGITVVCLGMGMGFGVMMGALRPH